MGFFLGCRKFIITDADAAIVGGCLLGDFAFVVPDPFVTFASLATTTTSSEAAGASRLFLFFDGFATLAVDAPVFFDDSVELLAMVGAASPTGSFFACDIP